MKKSFKYILISFFIVIFDQISKIGTEIYFYNQTPIHKIGKIGIVGYFNNINTLKEYLATASHSFDVLGSLLRITLTYNPGVAFGIRLGNHYFLGAISLVASILMSWYLVRIVKKNKLFEIWAFTFIIGGALGNMIDRFFFGKVVDMFDVDFPNFIMQRWPIFNVADSFVTIGMIMLIFISIFPPKIKV